jgi:AraC family transcriptional regulator, regulatory protein of adaptative response / methylated-DNA-[protein]-cysteine methyltransferase
MARMSATPGQFLSSRDFARIARAIRYIDVNFREQPRLSAVAAHVGLSEFHFNRLFRRWAGLTPKQFLARVTGAAAHLALNVEPSVLEAAHAVGLSGSSRLHDLVVTLDAMTPGELKSGGEGVRVVYGFTDSPFGTALFAETERGLCHLSFVEAGQSAASEAALRSQWTRAAFKRDDPRARELAETIWNPTAKRSTLRVHIAGTNFQLKVWEALLSLGARQSTNYTEVAAAIDASSSVRAVGNAVGANPVGYLIPCHHVLLRSRALGGYHWGVDRKRAMLAWEAFSETNRFASNIQQQIALPADSALPVQSPGAVAQGR